MARTPVKATTFPYVLPFTHVRLYAVVTLFVILDVAVPRFCHWIHPLAGPIFLPMFFFILLAGLLFGWRAGLLVGMITPLASYGISGMPDPAVLPGILIEAVCYGVAAGYFIEHRRMNVFTSVIAAMIIGRIASGVALLILYGGEVAPFAVVWKATAMAWPGILVQMTLLPILYELLEQAFSKAVPSDE